MIPKLNSSQSIFLDLLRFFAVQFVLIGHALDDLTLCRIEWLQNLSVVVFFILSGIVISYSTIQKTEKGYSLKEYLIDRFSRIYVAYVPCLIFIFALDFAHIYLDASSYSYLLAINIKTFVGNLFMLQDFPFQHVITSFGSGRPLWTLAIEWWLYMIFGVLLLKFWSKFDLKYVPLLLLCSVVPIYHIIGRGNSLTLLWIFGVMVTMSIPYFYKARTKSLYWLFIIFSLLFIIRIGIKRDAYDLGCGILISFLIALVLIYLSKNKCEVHSKLQSVTKSMVSYSFTLYLIHYSILDFITSMINHSRNQWLLLLITILLCNFVAKVLALYTEDKYKIFASFLKNKFNIISCKGI